MMKAVIFVAILLAINLAGGQSNKMSQEKKVQMEKRCAKDLSEEGKMFFDCLRENEMFQKMIQEAANKSIPEGLSDEEKEAEKAIKMAAFLSENPKYCYHLYANENCILVRVLAIDPDQAYKGKPTDECKKLITKAVMHYKQNQCKKVTV